jgi:uncharacterized protein (TIGR01619 family)
MLSTNKAQALTCGHKTFGVKWLFEHPATHQLSATVDTNTARSPKRFYTAKPLPAMVMSTLLKINILSILMISCQFDSQESRKKSQMDYQEKWDYYFCKVDDKKGSIYMDFGYKDIAPIKNYSKAYWITLSMNNPRPDGLSSTEESEKLFEIEDGLLIALSSHLDYKYVGRLTNDSKRFFYFYVKDTILIDKIVADYMVKYQDYQYELDYREDKNWNIYFDFLYPSPKEHQSLLNRHVIDNLKKGGDKLTKSREVDHWIYFKTAKDRQLFLDKIESDGFTVVDKRHDKKWGEYSYSLHIKRVDYVDWSNVDDYVLYLWQIASETNGDYDGWETQIVTEDE